MTKTERAKHIERVANNLTLACAELREYIVSGEKIPQRLIPQMRIDTAGTRKILEEIVLKLFYVDRWKELPWNEEDEGDNDELPAPPKPPTGNKGKGVELPW